MSRKSLSQGVRPDTPTRAATPADSWPAWTDLVVDESVLDLFGDDGRPARPRHPLFAILEPSHLARTLFVIAEPSHLALATGGR
jgi:hypothetical protein